MTTAAALFVLIVVFQPVSGVHFSDPLISAVDAALGFRRWPDALAHVPAQVAGGVAGAILANVMFGLNAVAVSTQDRLTWPHVLSEVVATAGLIVGAFTLARTGRSRYAAPAVAAVHRRGILRLEFNVVRQPRRDRWPDAVRQFAGIPRRARWDLSPLRSSARQLASPL